MRGLCQVCMHVWGEASLCITIPFWYQVVEVVSPCQHKMHQNAYLLRSGYFRAQAEQAQSIAPLSTWHLSDSHLA